MKPNKIYLFFDTSAHKKVKIGLIKDDNMTSMVLFDCKRQFEIKNKLLKNLDKLLNKNNFSLKNLFGIIVVNRSKEMTSLRLGISVANAIAYNLDVQIVGIKKEDEYKSALKKIDKLNKYKPIKPDYEINPMLNSEK